jgi:hypothetical protein
MATKYSFFLFNTFVTISIFWGHFSINANSSMHTMSSMSTYQIVSMNDSRHFCNLSIYACVVYIHLLVFFLTNFSVLKTFLINCPEISIF